MVLNLVKITEIVSHPPNPKILFILLHWTRSNSWLLLEWCICALWF